MRDSPLKGGTPGLGSIGDETPRWGRDDIKRLEVGSQGETLPSGVGSALGHLVGLGDEEPGRRNGEKIVSSDNARFPGEVFDVGAGIDHLWLLGDFDYLRASTDDPEEDLLSPRDARGPSFGPLAPDAMSVSMIEDNAFTGRIFDPAMALFPVNQRSITADPVAGTVVFNKDGTFVFTPADGFSGVTTVTFSFTDPRTGLIEKGTITITVEAVADPASISGAAATPEDVPVATPVTITLNDHDGSETIENVVIGGLPPGATLNWNTSLPGSIVLQPDGSFLVTGSTAEIQALMLSLSVSPPADFHGRITLDIAVTMIEANVDPTLPGYRDRETTHFAYNIDVEAVADPVTATGDNKVTDEDTAIHLDNLAATFGDLADGSEVHTVEIRGVDADAILRNAGGQEYPFVIAGDGTKTYTLSPSQVGDVYFLPPPDESGLFAGMTIVAIATEGSNGDQETASAPIQVLVNPVADPLDITAPSQATDEDTPVTFGDDITIVVNDPATQTVTEVVVSGFPAGTLVTYTTFGGATVTQTTVAGISTYTISGGSEQDIRDTLATLALTPPLHTDQNITLSVSATTEDLGGVTDTQTVPMTITVAAIADGPTISGAASGDEDAPIALPITVSRIDADGSESYDFAEITVPAGVTLIYPVTLPNGISMSQSGSVFTFTPGLTTTAAQFESFLATGLQVQAPADSDLNFDVSVRVGTIESVLSGGEVTLLRQDLTATVPVKVHPVNDMPVVTGSSVVDEDTSVGFGANIAISAPDSGDGSEAISQIVLGNIPAAATVTYTAIGGATVTPTTVAGVTSYTISGGSEQDIRDTLATFTLQPSLHTDQNIAVSVAITKVDRTSTESEVAATTTQSYTHNIAVFAVADGPTISGAASGNEDEPIALPITVSRIDADGSESYDFAEITVPAGVTLIYPATPPNGITVSVVGNVFTFTPGVATTAAQFESFLATGLQVQAPADSDVNFDVSVRVGTIESVLSGGEVTLLRQDLTATVPVKVHPVNDMPVVTGSSVVDEDTSVGFGANIAISAPDSGDGSEAISQIVLGNIPAAATVTYNAIGGATVTPTTVAGITSYTISGGSEQDIRDTLATFTLQPSLHTDQNIAVSVAITKVDRTSSESEAAATTTQTYTHDIAVAAVADGPTISGAASGNEDEPIALPITVSRIDADGSESYDFAEITVPAGVTLIYPVTLPNGITVSQSGNVFTFTPGVATTAAQFQSFLATGLQVRAPADSDVNFDVSVRVGTIESVLSGGEVTLLRQDLTATVPVTVHPVNDAPTFSGSSSVNEDGIVSPADQTVTAAVNFGNNIGISATDSGDGSEAVSQIVLGNVPAAATVTYTAIGGVTVTPTTVAGITSYTITGGSEANIRATLATFSLIPPPHSDADISVSIAVTKVDATSSEGEAAATQTYLGTHLITVAAIADVPTLSGSGAGFEDQNIPVSINVGHPDNTDGTEKIKNVVIAGVPSGLTLTEGSSGAGVLTPNGGGTYTVTGPNDAAINDVLANLTLVFASGGPRQHLDTEFDLSVTVTTIESAPSESGVGQIAQLETPRTFAVPVTVTAVADGVTKSGQSVVVEDIYEVIGGDIQLTGIDTDGTESITRIVISGIPLDASFSVTFQPALDASYFNVGSSWSLTIAADPVGGAGFTPAAIEASIRTALASFSFIPPFNTDTNLALGIAVTTADNDGSVITQNFTHNVVVQAVADMPSIDADDLSLNEDATAPLVIRPGSSWDDDNSETLSVRITVPADGSGVIGTLAANTSVSGVALSGGAGGVYTVTATGATPADREAALDSFLNGGITFTPRAQWSGVLTGTNGIKVEAISTENATLYGNTTASPDDELAPNDDALAGTNGDLDTKIEIATTYIDITVAAAADIPVLANASTIVQENRNLTTTSDPDLIIAIGTRLGMSIADTDGSQGLSLTLTGFPTNAQALSFGSSMAGVSTNVAIGTGTVTISGTNANNVLSVLNSLSITLADDDDRNFTVTINGTSTDTNGVTPVSSNFTLTHDVIVQAVADDPSVSVTAATFPAVNEDTGFVGYPVTTALNDTDGSETYQSIRLDFSTPGSGARPVLQFTAPDSSTIDTGTTGSFTIAGVTFVIASTGASSGQVTISGGTTAEIEAVMASLQVRPGADNGEDITITALVTSVESNPSEDNNGAGIGMGGGVVGPEISIPTAQASTTFTIPVTPVPETPSLTLPSAPTGAEDTTFALGAITVSSGSSDPDGSEALFIEIQTSSYPSGTAFTSGGSSVGSVVTTGWLRIAQSDLASLQITPPTHYSGTINLNIRGMIVDTTLNDVVTTVTAPSTLAVTVTPDADAIVQPSASVGVEDNGAVAFGADLANTTTGIRLVDNSSGTGNNSATETLSRVVLDFPADTATRTYTIAAGAAVGTAVVSFDAGTRAYTITSTLITGAADAGALSQADRGQAETDIRATLAGFTVTMGPTHSDLNGTVSVTATTLDVNGGLANTQDNTFNHTIRIQGVADTPSVTVVDPVTGVSEDGANIALTINAGNSLDADNSETLSVRITVPTDSLGPVGTIVGTPPAGVTLSDQGGGIYLITATGASNAAREALLDSFLNGGGIAFDPRANWSGSLTGSNGLMVEAISTEAANGNELAPGSFGGLDGTSKTETVIDYIDVVVTPVADAPTVKGNSVGLEDTIIPIPMSVTLADKDGSETYIVRITGGVPSGAIIYGAGGVAITPVAGVYTLSPADVAALAIQPPLHYSSPLQGDIVLVTETVVTDNSGGGTIVSSFVNNVVVEVAGVADVPGTRVVNVLADEDEPIGLGAAIVASAGGSLNNLLVDADSSEALSFVMTGLPVGVIPTSSVPSGVIYIGDGRWSITAAAMPTLELPPIPNFSGDQPYAGVTINAVTQEIDGDQATTLPWDVTIGVRPVINAGTVDGFSSWGLGLTQTEGATEGGADISLASVTSHAFVDDDGSERVVSYTFDLSGLIADAEIAAQLEVLRGPGAGLNELLTTGLISGTFTTNLGAGTITVLAADIGGVSINRALFLDSNEDFSIPVSALVRDEAVVGGSIVFVDKIETGSFNVDLVGTADVPTVFASDASGNSGTRIALTLGGDSTDTDVGLGRTLSEDIFYVLRTTNPGTAPLFGLVDSSGSLVGLDIGGGSFVLTAAELTDLHVITPGGAGGTIELELTTVATENDGDRAYARTNFQVDIIPVVGGGPGLAPLPPTVTVGASNGNEDGSITLNVTAAPAPGDPTNPAVSVIISGLPVGADVIGARLLPPNYVGEPPRWVASAAAVNSGAVSVIPPLDFSGTMTITVEGIARSANLQWATTGALPLPVDVDPVADGVAISATPATGIEDAPVALNISLGERDTDGNETIGSYAYVALSDGATLVGSYATVAVGDGFGDDTIDGTSLVGMYRVPIADLATLQMQPAPHWHGEVTVTVSAYSVEPLDDADGDNIQLDTASFEVFVTADADAPNVAAPASFSGIEDTAIALPGLSAALVDTQTANGAEVLSVKISGVPLGSVFSAGSNNGDGSWTIPVTALATLSLTPPLHYSGTMSLTLTGITLELVNGDEASASVGFDVVVAPRADTVEILAKNVAVGASSEAALDLNVRMADDNGTAPGENAAELIRITFTSVPTGVSMIATAGGALTSPSSGTWVFTGTEAQSNAVAAAASATATGGTYVVNLSAVTIDGADQLATPVTDTFQLVVPQVVTGTSSGESLSGSGGTQLLYGLGGADTIDGGAGDDYLAGGGGADSLTGGLGADTFAWQSGELGSGVDQISGFSTAAGDKLDVSALLSGFDAGSSVLSEFVRATVGGGNTTIAIDANGGGDSFQNLAVLQGVTGLNVDTMRTNGNLIV